MALNPSLSSLLSAERDVAVDDEALRRRTLALRVLITAVAEECPLTLLIDDVHWTDAFSFRAFETALGGIEERAYSSSCGPDVRPPRTADVRRMQH